MQFAAKTSGALLIAAALLCCHLQQSGAQFFTKSSKSIPRMGRRSLEAPGGSLRRLAIDRLVDEFGPNLLVALAVAGREEAALRAEQPLANEQPTDAAEEFAEQREPRAPADASLAMRAFNANRYLQHLASGRPLGQYGSGAAKQQPQPQQQQYSDK